jgi:hypothetical protein
MLIAEIRDDLVDVWSRLRRRRRDGSPPAPALPKM